MAYRTVFDVAQVGFQWWIPLLIFIFAAMFAGIGWAIRTSSDRGSVTKGLMFQLVGGAGVLLAFVFLVSMYVEYYNGRKALATHTYSVAEGEVTDFVPMPPGGHAIESFAVNGTHFEYGSGWGSTTFNSEWNKGFIHNGVQARISYVGKDIIRVEVR